jgi:hypothetical protein
MLEHFSNRKRILELEERFEKLQRDFHALQMDWANQLDKLQQMAGRIAKRTALLSQEREDAMMGKGSDHSTAELVEPQPLSGLSPRASEIQARILARRNRMTVQPRNGGE